MGAHITYNTDQSFSLLSFIMPQMRYYLVHQVLKKSIQGLTEERTKNKEEYL